MLLGIAFARCGECKREKSGIGLLGILKKT